MVWVMCTLFCFGTCTTGGETWGGQDWVQLEDRPASLCSAVWEHYRVSVSYDSDGEKVVDKKKTKQACATAHAIWFVETSPQRVRRRRSEERDSSGRAPPSPPTSYRQRIQNWRTGDVYSEGGFQHPHSTGAVTLHVQQVAGTSFCLHKVTQTPKKCLLLVKIWRWRSVENYVKATCFQINHVELMMAPLLLFKKKDQSTNYELNWTLNYFRSFHPVSHTQSQKTVENQLTSSL